MAKIAIAIVAFTICFFTDNVLCHGDATSLDSDNRGVEKSDSNIRKKIWGIKARDALLFGMWSIHLDGTGEYFGDGRNNDQNYLVGLQYSGVSGGAFINSKDDLAFFLGPAREVYSYNLSDGIRFDVGYKFGLLYGYGDDLINVGGVSIFAAGTMGISWKKIGFDLGIIPVGVVTASFRFDID